MDIEQRRLYPVSHLGCRALGMHYTKQPVRLAANDNHGERSLASGSFPGNRLPIVLTASHPSRIGLQLTRSEPLSRAYLSGEQWRPGNRPFPLPLRNALHRNAGTDFPWPMLRAFPMPRLREADPHLDRSLQLRRLERRDLETQPSRAKEMTAYAAAFLAW